MTHTLDEHGFEIVPRVVELTECEALIKVLRLGTVAGQRGLLANANVRKLAHSAKLLDVTRAYLPAEPQPVRAIYFNKSAESNWLVPWHQDLTIAVREKLESEGFGPWSTKEGIPHVQPPVEYLEQMLAVRIHLDDANEINGALKVLANTHQLGRLSANQIQELRSQREEYLCSVSAGDVMLMRPLLLHASSRSTSDRPRRVLHIEYAGFDLPSGLKWHEAA